MNSDLPPLARRYRIFDTFDECSTTSEVVGLLKITINNKMGLGEESNLMLDCIDVRNYISLICFAPRDG